VQGAGAKRRKPATIELPPMKIGGLEAEFQVQQDRLVVVVTGSVSYQSAYSLLEESLDRAKPDNVSRILVDTLAVDGPLTPKDRQNLGRALAVYAASDLQIKMAFIASDAAGAGVAVAQQSGVAIRMFRTRDEGMQWLDGAAAGRA
jgi:hypothetical protein